MARPTEEVVLWAAQDVTLPALAGPNKVLPISDLINKGWDMNQKPAADEFNYLLNNYAKWLIYLDEKSGGANPDAPEVDSLPSTTPLRDTDGKGCFKGIKASNTTNANAFNMLDTYNSKTSVSVSLNGNKVCFFVHNGLLSSGDGISGLACNTSGMHYGNVVGNATSADKALKWTNARTITFNGDVVGSVVLDGASNVSCNLTVSSASSTSVITGFVSSGGTVPLPSGYTEAQCRWIVSLRSISATNDISDIYVLLTGRVVTVAAESTESWTNATAWYMCIGVK